MTVKVDLNDKSRITENLKEAVAESILNGLYQRAAGIGEFGLHVVDKKPSQRFVSGFIESFGLAKSLSNDVDASVNPIHIISHGFDVEMNKKRGKVTVTPSFSIYLRVLPRVEDLINHPTQISLTNNAQDLLYDKINVHVENYKRDHPLPDKKNEPATDAWYKGMADVRTKAMHESLIEVLGERISQTKTADVEVDENQKLENLAAKEGEDKSLTDTVNTGDQEDQEQAGRDIFAFVVRPGDSLNLKDELFKEVPPLQRWQRLDLHDLPRLEFYADDDASVIQKNLITYNTQINSRISEKIRVWLHDDSETGGRKWAFPKRLRVTPSDIINWPKKLEDIRKNIHQTPDGPSTMAIPELTFAIVAEIYETMDRHLRQPFRQMRLAVENRTESGDPFDAETEQALFQIQLQALIEREAHKPVNLGRVKPSYQYSNYLQYPAIGFNSGLKYAKHSDAVLIESDWMPTYRQPRIRPRPYPSVPVKFSELVSESGIQRLVTIQDEFLKWIEKAKIESKSKLFGSNELETRNEEDKFERDVDSWKKEAEMIQLGVELLIRSLKAFKDKPESPEAIPYIAWKCLNETMLLAGKDKGFDSWRLFQIAFILANISGITSRMGIFQGLFDNDWDDSVSLLYFATGGGKTESFFGLLIYNLFLDRLRGKKHGVTAMIRYPLRLLTIQQAQRLAKTLAFAERVKRNNSIPGDPFAIGFWVGSSNTPNNPGGYTDRQVPDIMSGLNDSSSDEEYKRANENWNKLPKCPFCKGDTVLRSFKCAEQSGGKLLGHVCKSAPNDCDWNAWNSHSVTPLPLYVVDTDIYRKAPAVVLGTVDKLALIANRPGTMRKVFGMLGTAPFRNENTGDLVFYKTPSEIADLEANFKHLKPFYNNGENYFHDPFPSLIIQDEAHLLEESLGTFSGLFETAFEKMLEEMATQCPDLRQIVAITNQGNIRMPKIVAASATVTEPRRQMQGLYQRDVVQFPAPGHKLYYNFYAEPELSEVEDRAELDDIELAAKTARIYTSILTNGRPHTSASVELIGYFHLTITILMDSLCSDDPSVAYSAKQEMKAILTNSSSPHKERFIEEIDVADNSSLATLVDLHRIALTYVTNKKGGDQIQAAEGDIASRIHDEAGHPIEGIGCALISGAVSAGEIEAVIARAEERPRAGEKFEDIHSESILRSVVATSAISHGVDVDEFNSMFFAGMPSVAAEYIQSSSRVGRTHVGLSVLIPTPQRRRDRYVAETHDQYHRFLERMIRPAPVNRWAENAIIRTLASMILGYFIIIEETIKAINLPVSDKKDAVNMDKLSQIRKLKIQRGETELVRTLENFVFDATGLNHPDFYPSAVNEIKGIIRDELRYFYNFLFKDSPDITDIWSAYEDMEIKTRNRKITPMTSLRDVDPAGFLKYVKETNKSPDARSNAVLMSLIRKRGQA
ncbi:MAG TPA: helicase [Methylophaga aminisulfidivorans]|uniref:Helicase n=3 Tax=root TaxID=1 RepID=A0A7C1VTM3_9GAMM|nr:helicase [Methylophaga aminisulfidivorans]